jgi:uncharacterized protein
MAKDPIPKEIFDILACPLCRNELEYTKGKKGLVCTSCAQKYPITQGIPVLLPPKR